ncbi:hypothetical protein AAVH_03289 [Aphelenchoides avenae]|nr:hypothetical protein AAVH_03289 [Aphelenchus avenae]
MSTVISSPLYLIVLVAVTLTCTAAADELYSLTDSADIPESFARDRKVEYSDGVARINVKYRRQNYTIAVKNKEPLTFSVGNKRNCRHADMITFNIDDEQPRDKNNRYGLHFLWRQKGGKFEVHQSDRDASMTPINVEWTDEDRERTAAVALDDDQVKVQLQKQKELQKLCLRESNTTCSFARSEKEFEKGDDVFRLAFTTHNDRKCGLFVELVMFTTTLNSNMCLESD